MSEEKRKRKPRVFREGVKPGRSLKYGEPTDYYAVRVPASKKPLIAAAVAGMLKTMEVTK